MANERDELLDKMLGIPGKAAQTRGKVQDAKKKLDAKGVEHKAKQDKGLLEDLRERLAAAVGEAMDNPPDDLVDAVLAVVVEAGMAKPPEEMPMEEAPPAEMPMTEETALDEEIPVDDDEEDEEDKALTVKAVTLFDSLIETQAQLAQDMSGIAKKQAELEPLLDLTKAVNALTERINALDQRIGAVEKQLKGRPRMASRAPETEVDTSDLSDDIKKHLIKRDPVFRVNVGPEVK